jgi:hypothetical protein
LTISAGVFTSSTTSTFAPPFPISTRTVGSLLSTLPATTAAPASYDVSREGPVALLSAGSHADSIGHVAYACAHVPPPQALTSYARTRADPFPTLSAYSAAASSSRSAD